MKPLEVAKAVVRLRQVGASDDFAAIEQALLSADELLKDEPDFQKFLSEKQRASEIAQVNARTTAVAELRRTSVFIESFVGKNLLHESVNDLLQLQERIEVAQKSGQDEQIFNMQKAAQLEVGRLGLSSELANFVYEVNAPAKKDIEEASNGIAVTESNRELLEGHRNDVLILGNFTAQAPHLLVDLLSKPTFDGGSVVYCWTAQDSKPPLFDLVLPILRSMGGLDVLPKDKCSPETATSSDVLLIERRAFLSQDVLEARPLIEAFEAEKLKIIKTILWSEAGQSGEMDKGLAASIRDKVIGKARVGFGLLRFDNGSRTLCLTVPPPDEGFHRAAYDELSQLVRAYVNAGASARLESPALFPALRQWKQEQDVDGWVQDRFTDELVDYGTAEWQGRRLEAVLIKASVTTKNPVRGQYQDVCFVLGYLIDGEFGVRRDPLMQRCDEGGPSLSQWQAGRAFESRWVAPVSHGSR